MCKQQPGGQGGFCVVGKAERVVPDERGQARRYRSKVMQGHGGMIRNVDFILRAIGDQ